VGLCTNPKAIAFAWKRMLFRITSVDLLRVTFMLMVLSMTRMIRLISFSLFSVIAGNEDVKKEKRKTAIVDAMRMSTRMAHGHDIISCRSDVTLRIDFYQIQKSEAILASFLALILPSCRVVRGGVIVTLPAADLVKGDVVSLVSQVSRVIVMQPLLMQFNSAVATKHRLISSCFRLPTSRLTIVV